VNFLSYIHLLFNTGEGEKGGISRNTINFYAASILVISIISAKAVYICVHFCWGKKERQGWEDFSFGGLGRFNSLMGVIGFFLNRGRGIFSRKGVKAFCLFRVEGILSRHGWEDFHQTGVRGFSPDRGVIFPSQGRDDFLQTWERGFSPDRGERNLS